MVPDNLQGLCTPRSTIRSVFPKDPLGRIISFGLLGIVLSVMSFIFLRSVSVKFVSGVFWCFFNVS